MEDASDRSAVKLRLGAAINFLLAGVLIVALLLTDLSTGVRVWLALTAALVIYVGVALLRSVSGNRKP